MSLSHNERLFQVFEYLKESGKLKTYVQFGELISENKAGVNDLKTGRKKATIEHFFRLKKSYHELSSDYLIGVSDGLLCDAVGDKHAVSPIKNSPNPDQQAVIDALRETVASKNETIQALRALIDKPRPAG
ncbi:hypothetical protein [Parapedobacter tibetensis]|uniref:hypothetical protein n=1 Tax=Parapedobacter tibetensis TaxID=2972951 RepID=UPI00214D1EE8|nr:hypothetical protein [Parapedobacter tibetensis]